MSEVLVGYRLQPAPYPGNAYTQVSFFQGTNCNNFPVVVKKHDFGALIIGDTREQVEKAMNAGLEQAGIQHAHICPVYEVRLVITGKSCSVFHVLEPMETNVGQDIEDRKKSNQPYTEAEMWAFLQQVSEALAYAHSLEIAHRDIKPSNVFRTKETYKVADFGEYWRMKRDPTTSTLKGDDRYFSPQMRAAHLSGKQYDAMKNDVFALGATWLEMASFGSPNSNSNSEDTVRKLHYSEELKQTLRLMLEVEEGRRCNMQTVSETSNQNVSKPVTSLAALERRLLEVVEGISSCEEIAMFERVATMMKKKALRVQRAEALRVQQEQAAKAARVEEMKRAAAAGACHMQCGVCRVPAAGAKCTKCKTIYWANVFQAKEMHRSSSVAPKEYKVLQKQLTQREANGQGGRARANSAGAPQTIEQQYVEDKQRGRQRQMEVSNSTQIFVCDRCQVQTQKPGLCDECMGLGVVRKVICMTCKARYPADQDYCRKCEIVCPRCRKSRLRTLPRCLNCTTACSQCRTAFDPQSGICRRCEIACPQCRAPKLRSLPRCLNCTPACPQCMTPYDPQFGICRRCEVICKGCGKVASSTQSYCVHCNTVLKEKLCKQCKQLPVSGPSGLCKGCASRPSSLPSSSYEEKKAQPQAQASLRPSRQGKR